MSEQCFIEVLQPLLKHHYFIEDDADDVLDSGNADFTITHFYSDDISMQVEYVDDEVRRVKVVKTILDKSYTLGLADEDLYKFNYYDSEMNKISFSIWHWNTENTEAEDLDDRTYFKVGSKINKHNNTIYYDMTFDCLFIHSEEEYE